MGAHIIWEDSAANQIKSMHLFLLGILFLVFLNLLNSAISIDIGSTILILVLLLIVVLIIIFIYFDMRPIKISKRGIYIGEGKRSIFSLARWRKFKQVLVPFEKIKNFGVQRNLAGNPVASTTILKILSTDNKIYESGIFNENEFRKVIKDFLENKEKEI